MEIYMNGGYGLLNMDGCVVSFHEVQSPLLLSK